MNDDYLSSLGNGYLNSNSSIRKAADIALWKGNCSNNNIRATHTVPDYTITSISDNVDSPYYYNYNYAPPINTEKESILEDIITFCSGFCPLGQEKICDETTKKTCPLGKRIKLEGRG